MKIMPKIFDTYDNVIDACSLSDYLHQSCDLNTEAANNVFNAAGRFIGITANANENFNLYFNIDGYIENGSSKIPISVFLQHEDIQLLFEVSDFRHLNVFSTTDAYYAENNIIVPVNAAEKKIPNGIYKMHLCLIIPGAETVNLFNDPDISLIIK